MTSGGPERTAADDRAIRIAISLIVAAFVAAMTSALAGIALIVGDPEAGSTTEAVLGIGAAIAGLSTAVFVIAGLIYIQIKNLWRFVPTWLRIAAWLVIGIGIAITLWNLIQQPG